MSAGVLLTGASSVALLLPSRTTVTRGSGEDVEAGVVPARRIRQVRSEHPDHVGAAADLLVEPLSELPDQIWRRAARRPR